MYRREATNVCVTLWRPFLQYHMATKLHLLTANSILFYAFFGCLEPTLMMNVCLISLLIHSWQGEGGASGGPLRITAQQTGILWILQSPLHKSGPGAKTSAEPKLSNNNTGLMMPFVSSLSTWPVWDTWTRSTFPVKAQTPLPLSLLGEPDTHYWNASYMMYCSTTHITTRTTGS